MGVSVNLLIHQIDLDQSNQTWSIDLDESINCSNEGAEVFSLTHSFIYQYKQLTTTKTSTYSITVPDSWDIHYAVKNVPCTAGLGHWRQRSPCYTLQQSREINGAIVLCSLFPTAALQSLGMSQMAHYSLQSALLLLRALLEIRLSTILPYGSWLKSSALHREKGGIMNVSPMTVDECVVNNSISSVALRQQLLMALARWPCDSGRLLLMAGDHRGMGL